MLSVRERCCWCGTASDTCTAKAAPVAKWQLQCCCVQAALLAGGRGNARASMRPGSGAGPRMSGLPRHSVPSMRKEVVLATKAELADRKPSREEPLSTFDLEKLKAFSRGWTPDRGRGKKS